MQDAAGTYQRLSKIDCLLAYSNVFGNRSDVIMVTSNATAANNSGNAVLAYGLQLVKEWSLGSALAAYPNTFNLNGLDLSYFSGDVAKQTQAVANWTMGGFHVDYCLASQSSIVQDKCDVEYSLSVMIGRFISTSSRADILGRALLTNCLVVCIFNLFKVVCILCLALMNYYHKDPSLVILGDAICSFLKSPDQSTRGMSIISKKDMTDDEKAWSNPEPRKWQALRLRWHVAPRTRRWLWCIAL